MRDVRHELLWIADDHEHSQRTALSCPLSQLSEDRAVASRAFAGSPVVVDVRAVGDWAVPVGLASRAIGGCLVLGDLYKAVP